jgi:hypothetical protein
MNRYLRYLKAEEQRPNDPANRAILRADCDAVEVHFEGTNLHLRLPGELPKLPKADSGTSGSFGSAGGSHFLIMRPAECEDIRPNSEGTLHDESAPHSLPWGPRMSSCDVRRLLDELHAMIEELARVEGWPSERLADIMTRAIRGPLTDLLPNVAHFGTRLREQRAHTAARELLAKLTWRGRTERPTRLNYGGKRPRDGIPFGGGLPDVCTHDLDTSRIASLLQIPAFRRGIAMTTKAARSRTPQKELRPRQIWRAAARSGQVRHAACHESTCSRRSGSGAIRTTDIWR